MSDTTTYQRDRHPGGHGIRPHAKRDDRTTCPACHGHAPTIECRYCQSEGRVSPIRARTIEMMLASKTTPRVGGDPS
jgi:DnaJ-class molecular chaperone